MKNIYYSFPRRKWENDLVNIDFNNFNLSPKADIDFDNITTNKNGLKSKLKKFKVIKFLIEFRNFLKLKVDNYVPKSNFKGRENYQGAIMFQRFLRNSNMPYVVYVENSHSILGYTYEHYENQKLRSKINRELRKCIEDNNFKGFVFFSERSKEGFYSYFRDVYKFEEKFLDVIYPYVKDNNLLNEDIINKKILELQENKAVKLLYISSMFSLKGGCEIIEAYRKLIRMGYKIHLTIVTNKKSIPQKYKQIIELDENINVLDNKLNTEELFRLFNDNHILLHPTFMDSTAIVIMEALKSGLPVITTDTFAIPEYIVAEKNGYLIENPIKYYDLDLNPNKPLEYYGGEKTAEYIDDYKSNTLYNFIVDDIAEKIIIISKDFKKFIFNTLDISKLSNYSEEVIRDKWDKIINNTIINNE
ncbi:glycosyltransferase, group 1 family protein [Clostridiales bacterium oral taxon 876 str. F0540]|nr:glycosyltransferase, group 1 family protein [Clostridiales bacterium oral taxon 876 str. F0540]